MALKDVPPQRSPISIYTQIEGPLSVQERSCSGHHCNDRSCPAHELL